MRLRPLEIKVSVNYARLSINIVRLANGLKLRRPGAWTGALRDFNPAYVRFGSNSVIAAMSAAQPLFHRKRKSIGDLGMSQRCPKRASSGISNQA
jgi:hypothetical protein